MVFCGVGVSVRHLSGVSEAALLCARVESRRGGGGGGGGGAGEGLEALNVSSDDLR